MKKHFYKTKFLFLCTPIDIDFCVCGFLVVKLVGELDVEFGRGIGAACAAGVKCFFIHYYRQLEVEMIIGTLNFSTSVSRIYTSSLAGNIIVYMSKQGTKREEHFVFISR